MLIHPAMKRPVRTRMLRLCENQFADFRFWVTTLALEVMWLRKRIPVHYLDSGINRSFVEQFKQFLIPIIFMTLFIL